MSDKNDEQRIAALERDPDGIDWKANGVPPARSQGPLGFTDAMLSVLMNLSGFHEVFARRMRAHLARGRRANDTVDAHGATTAALVEVLANLMRVHREMVQDGLAKLELAGVPRPQLIPQLVGQDWGESSLTSSGRLDLRARFWMRKAASTAVKLERTVQILIPREARAVVVKSS